MDRRWWRTNLQLIVTIGLLIVAGIAWFVLRQYESKAIATEDASLCWTASCRDVVFQRHLDRTEGRLKTPKAGD
ncbi:hypothetical protein [Sphingomonas metalli]|uniref:hypothetical protein n=1 Tax=Sphingomonas metalli TaxID=1779358 RepID=UPI00166E1C32|nr:hypothetical protein [Sphingomonas metalli]